MEATQTTRTLGQVFNWKDRFMTYTDMVCEGVPDAQAALRPVDPKEGFVFSAMEQAAHIADTRWMFINWVTGEEVEERFFMQEYGGTDKPWEFRELTKDEVLGSLRESRAKIEKIFAWPASRILETTDALLKTHNERREQMLKAEQDISELDAAGPNTMANVIMFMMAHEQAHRAVLQHMLRISGADVARMA